MTSQLYHSKLHNSTPESNPIMSRLLWSLDPYWPRLPPGWSWPWKRGSSRRLLFLFPGPWWRRSHIVPQTHFCQDSTFQASRVLPKPPRGFTLLMIDRLKHAAIRFINPPPLHALFHHNILVLTPRSAYHIYAKICKFIPMSDFLLLWCFREMN